MRYICNSYQVDAGSTFRDYSDLDEYVTKSGIEGILLGEDASNYMSFHAIEARQPFTGHTVRIGIILDGTLTEPEVCPIHAHTSLAIGMNSSVRIVDLASGAIADTPDLGCWFHHFLCNANWLVAVHELGAMVMQLSDFRVVANIDCDVVADATLSADELVLVSMEEEITRVHLGELEE